MRIARRSAVLLSVLTLLGWGGWLAGNYVSPEPEPVGQRMLSEAAQTAVKLPETPSVVAFATPLRRPVDATSEVRLHQLESQLAQLRQQLQVQQDRLQQQREEFEHLARLLEPKALPRVADVPNEITTPLESEEDLKLTRVAQLEAELTTQPFAVAGKQKVVEQVSIAVEQALEDLGPEAESHTTLLEAECRTTLCRIELSHANERTMESFLYGFTQHLGWQASAYIDIVPHADGSLSTVIYLSQDGHDLPKLSN